MSNKIYVTFGWGHIHKVNGKTFDKDCVAVIKGDYDTVVKNFGRKFSRTFDRVEDVGMEYYHRGLIEV